MRLQMKGQTRARVPTTITPLPYLHEGPRIHIGIGKNQDLRIVITRRPHDLQENQQNILPQRLLVQEQVKTVSKALLAPPRLLPENPANLNPLKAILPHHLLVVADPPLLGINIRKNLMSPARIK